MVKYIDRTTPIPLYFQVKSSILREIQNGTYPVGSKLPAENQLQEAYGVSRSTIRQALADLTNMGWLERKAGKGTFISEPQNSKNLFRSFEPFYQRVNRFGKRPRTEVLELSIIEANEMLAKSMKLEPGAQVISMFRRRYIDDEPVLTLRNYLPFDRCAFILEHDYKNESLYEVLTQNPESRISKTHSVVSAEKAKGDDLLLLNVKPDTPMLVFKNTATTDDETIIDLAFTRYRSDLIDFEIDTYPE